jgi:hypothetical protein
LPKDKEIEMSVETKRREILQMLAKGSISAAEAGELLSQLKNESEAAPSAPEVVEPVAEPGRKARWLNVRVTDAATQRKKVTVKLPLALARIGLRVGAKYAPEIEEVDWEELLAELSDEGLGTIVDVHDEEDGEHVEIYFS